MNIMHTKISKTVSLEINMDQVELFVEIIDKRMAELQPKLDSLTCEKENLLRIRKELQNAVTGDWPIFEMPGQSPRTCHEVIAMQNPI